MSSDSLNIRYVKNGFIVSCNDAKSMGYASEEWVFENPESLASFISNWGNECFDNDNKEKVSTQ